MLMDIKELHRSEKSVVTLVIDPDTGTRYVRKQLQGSHPVYAQLQAISHPYLPNIIQLEQQADGVTLLEEYIDGASLAEITLPEKQYRALTADLSSADITTAALTAESLTLQSSSGDIEAAGNYGTAAIRSTSGDVRLEGLACSGKLQVGSTSGDVAAEGLSCGDLEASTTSGDLKLAGRAGFAAVSSSSGNVKLDGLRSASEFRIKTVSGDIRGSGVEGTLLTVATTSGNIRLDGRYMGLQLNTTSGNADLTTSAALDSLRSDSVSGTVTVVMPDNGGFDLSFHKLSGSFHSDFPTTQDGERYRYGDGGRSFSVNTVSGDFHLRQNG